MDKAAPIHKAINLNIYVKLCDIYIERKYMRVVKSKRMILTTQRLKEIYVGL